MRVLVVEDERKIAEFICKGLHECGFLVELCDRGDDGLIRLMNEPFDAVLLDVMLPGQDGLSVLRELRRAGRDIPTLILTARSGLEDRIAGLNAGADDYLPKPFYIEELVARLHAIVRRRDGRAASLLCVGELVLDLPAREARIGDREVELTAREFNLLELLARAPGRVFTRTMLYEQV